MLKHRFSGTERSGDESRSSFNNWIRCIDDAHTGFEQFKRTWFFSVHIDGFFYRPFLHHSHFHVFTISISQHRNGIHDPVFTRRYKTFHYVSTHKTEWHHNLVRLRIFIYFSKPCSSLNFITLTGYWFKLPEHFLIQREIIFTTLQEDAGKLVEVILQSVVISRK
ncbi:hypothetical protein SDC9_111227 [bioreactor metagenome]|uniref:Uncharacterized protein n=1 Tax=bioreactor metagenome TaxID=1076179 RepID=A0A645BIE3_9ZZZZ